MEDLIFMQDRASVIVREWLNPQLPGKQISHRGSHAWPPRWLDFNKLTTFDFFSGIA